jgi:hypothetical protein
MKENLRHKVRYFYWQKECPIKKVEHSQWNAIVKSMNLQKENTGAWTPTKNWFRNSWQVIERGNFLQLYHLDENLQQHRYGTYLDPNKNTEDADQVSGRQSYSEINTLFKQSNKIKITEAFGTLPKSWNIERQCCKSCTNIVWHNEEYAENVFGYGCYKADISSAFPYNALGKLPDANTRLVVDEIVEPTNEYEFAFYDNGDVAIYDELDTKDEHYHNHILCRSKWSQKPTKTVLMKRSSYVLDEPLKIMYAKKENTKLEQRGYWKSCLVSLIGFMYSTNSDTKNADAFMPHIAAVILARYVKQIVGIYDTITNEENGIVLQVLTDSILWHGIPSMTATDKKTLGAFVYEAKAGKAVSFGGGQYAIESKDAFIVKGQSIKNFKAIVEERNIATVNSFYKFMTSPEGRKLSKLKIDEYDTITHLFTIDN